jgi:penicillin amidase
VNIARLLFRSLLGERLPILSGTLKVPGTTSPILIRRDPYGIPYIKAEGEDDAWYGLGFCQGQDRAFQIEMSLRAARGTLAELIGADALPVDRLSRRIGFRQAAEQQLACMDEASARALEAFARGVTDGASIGCQRRPHEFALLRTKPTPYTATDVLGLGKLMAFLQLANWDSELARLKILIEDGPEALAALDYTYPEHLPVTSPPGAKARAPLDRLAEDLAIFKATLGHGSGSNNWAIAPARTATGRPLLANDPHLPPSLPPFWYLAHLRTPDWTVVGASLTGTPAYPIGNNGTAAWGVTDGRLDQVDLFVEEIGPDGRSVRRGDQFVPCEIRSETLQVKGETAVTEEVLVTSHGPIISPALEGEVETVSLRATWLTPRPGKGFLGLYSAHTFEDFQQSFRNWPFGSYNMVYADTSGSIGWQLVGEAPKRRKGWGTIPLPGWLPDVGWEEDSIPFEDMPHVANPTTGFVATANNQPLQEGTDPFLGVDWCEGYRQARLVEVLGGRDDWDLPSTQALQMDQHCLPWQEMRRTVLATPAKAEEIRTALSLLEAWDGSVTEDSPAAAVFEVFLAEITQRMVAAKAPKAARWALGEGFNPLFPHTMLAAWRVGKVVEMLRAQPEGWFERPWPEEIAEALTSTIRYLRREQGDSSNKWAWGKVRPLTLEHPVGERWPLNRIFNLGPFPWGGDTNTVGQVATYLSDPTENPMVLPSLRAAIDVGNWEENRFVLPGGQSGNPLSPHYDDLLPLWKKGDGVTLAWSEEKIERIITSTLHLEPE